MPKAEPRILVTAASGQLGALVVAELLKTVPPDRLVATSRRVEALAPLAARGVTVRAADYGKPEILDAALAGCDRVLLISSSELGRRVEQHRNVIDAAKRAGVSLLAYTSVLRADTSPLSVADEHRPTEAAIRASGLPHVLLRNGWYTENYTAGIATALAHNAVLGSAGDGRISSAARADYAAAAAAVLTASQDQAGKTYELAGDDSYTLTEFAAELARQSGKPVSFKNLPEADYKAVLVGAGLPDAIAHLIAQSSACTAKGALHDESHALSRLIGRKTTSMKETVASALQGLLAGAEAR
jgi:NAD(P)H dehydrogenase (quinone)